MFTYVISCVEMTATECPICDCGEYSLIPLWYGNKLTVLQMRLFVTV